LTGFQPFACFLDHAGAASLQTGEDAAPTPKTRRRAPFLKTTYAVQNTDNVLYFIHTRGADFMSCTSYFDRIFLGEFTI